jgi:hypothetical protein
MRIVLFTVDELQFVPALLEQVLNRFGNQIVAAYISKSLFSWSRRPPGYYVYPSWRDLRELYKRGSRLI